MRANAFPRSLVLAALFSFWATRSASAAAFPFKELPGFALVPDTPTNVWVPFDVPAFAIQGHGNAGYILMYTGATVPMTSGASRLPAEMLLSSKLEYVFGGGADVRNGLPHGTYIWTRGKGRLRDNGRYAPNKTTTYWTSTEALNERLLELPRTDRLRVYAWCNSAWTPGLHAPTQLRLRVKHAWLLPYEVPSSVLEAPGFSPVSLSDDLASTLVKEGEIQLPRTHAKQLASMLAPGGYARVPFNGRLARWLPDPLFARLNNWAASHPRVVGTFFGRISYTPTTFLGPLFAAVLTGKALKNPAEAALFAGLGVAAAVGTSGVVRGIGAIGFKTGAKKIAGALPVIGELLLAGELALLIANGIEDADASWADIWDAFAGNLDKPVSIAGRAPTADAVEYID